MAIPSFGDPGCETAKQNQKLALEAKASRWRPRSEESRLLPHIASPWPRITLWRYGQTPLSFAAEIGHVGVVKILCMNGADVGAVDGGNHTPLSRAAINGNEDAIRVLIDAGSDMETRSAYRKKTPLHWAVFKRRVESTRLLLQRGAQVDAEDTLFGTALCYAAGEGHLDVVKLFLEHGADTELTSWHEEAPLSLAAELGHVDVVRLLLAYGANIDAKNREGETALDLVRVAFTDKGVEFDEVIEVLKSH
ncbi:ankyrin repeat-containing [Fusarium acutatum]|uniref:Ankyrin repeat-containing n=1 Tax=Fusarium acutatum TaxID=78861 RepID=A0A8H4K570_9HYPO|nr:ankyrin repeat-containing [Fusarium acutatum]